jgi:hypothetical protein
MEYWYLRGHSLSQPRDVESQAYWMLVPRRKGLFTGVALLIAELFFPFYCCFEIAVVAEILIGGLEVCKIFVALATALAHMHHVGLPFGRL